MELEEIQDMAISAVRKQGIDSVGENSMKILRNIKDKEDVLGCVMLMMFVADEFKINLEDELLNKIERVLRI